MSTAVMSEDQIAEEWSKVTTAPVSDEAKRSLALLQKKLNEARDAGAAQVRASSSLTPRVRPRSNAFDFPNAFYFPSRRDRRRPAAIDVEKSLRIGVHHANGVVWEAVSPRASAPRARPSRSVDRSPTLSFHPPHPQTSSKPVDWAGLKAKSPHPDIVDQYEAVHASHAFKSWDGVWEGKDVVKESAAEFAKFAAEARAVADNATKELESINQKLAELEAQQEKLSTITLEEVFKEDPKLMEETHARVRKGEWYAD